MSSNDSSPDPSCDASAAHAPRTLVLCFDGTSNEYDGTNTNVVRFFSLLKQDNTQLLYYQAGVGTYFNPGIISPALLWIAKILDMCFAWYLNAHVMGGYTFLMQNYREGDRICLFGFSRGAYTARALAGMLNKVGLLPKDNPEQVPFAYQLYQQTDKAGIEQSAGFKQTFSRSVTIEFLGVWETVASVGLIMTRTLPFTMSNTAIKTFRHALSLDEHRARFRPTLYHRPAPTASAAAADPEHASPVIPDSAPEMEAGLLPKKKKVFRKFRKEKPNGAPASARNSSVDAVAEDKVAAAARPMTDVLEVWFAGCHSDVGGGAQPDGTPATLADIPLRWMVREVVAAQCGIAFDDAALARLAGVLGAEITAPQAPLDAVDAVQAMDDELKKNPAWWVLEILPYPFACQDANGVWHNKWSINFGRGRVILQDHPIFHESVTMRMDDKALKYTPRAKYTKGSETYVN